MGEVRDDMSLIGMKFTLSQMGIEIVVMQGHIGTMVVWEHRSESVEMVRAISVMLSVDCMALKRHFAFSEWSREGTIPQVMVVYVCDMDRGRDVLS